MRSWTLTMGLMVVGVALCSCSTFAGGIPLGDQHGALPTEVASSSPRPSAEAAKPPTNTLDTSFTMSDELGYKVNVKLHVEPQPWQRNDQSSLPGNGAESQSFSVGGSITNATPGRNTTPAFFFSIVLVYPLGSVGCSSGINYDYRGFNMEQLPRGTSNLTHCIVPLTTVQPYVDDISVGNDISVAILGPGKSTPIVPRTLSGPSNPQIVVSGPEAQVDSLAAQAGAPLGVAVLIHQGAAHDTWGANETRCVLTADKPRPAIGGAWTVNVIATSPALVCTEI